MVNARGIVVVLFTGGGAFSLFGFLENTFSNVDETLDKNEFFFFLIGDFLGDIFQKNASVRVSEAGINFIVDQKEEVDIISSFRHSNQGVVVRFERPDARVLLEAGPDAALVLSAVGLLGDEVPEDLDLGPPAHLGPGGRGVPGIGKLNGDQGVHHGRGDDLGHSVLCWHRVVEHIELINVNIRLYVVYFSDVFFLLRCLLGELLPSLYMVFPNLFR